MLASVAPALLCLLIAIGAPAARAQQGDPTPGILSLLDPDRLAKGVFQAGIAALRMRAEVSYRHLSTDIVRGRVSIAGVELRPLLPWDRSRQCLITADRAVIGSSAGPIGAESTELSLDMVGATARPSCLPPSVAGGLRAAGLNEVDLDRFRIRARYDYASGRITAYATLAVADVAALDLHARATPVPVRRDGEVSGPPALRVTDARITLEDDGGWDRARGLLPPALTEPETLKAVLREQVTGALAGDAASPQALSGVERNFVDALVEKAGAFAAVPGRLVVEAVLPGDGVLVDPEEIEGPGELIAALALEVRDAPQAREEILPPGRLAVLERPGGELDDAARLELAGALIDGRGVPRAPGRAAGLLAPLLGEGEAPDPRAAALMARALAAEAPERAYRFALAATGATDATGATGATGAQGGTVALLDRLEARLTTPQVLAAQAGELPDSAAPGAFLSAGEPSVRAIRDRALAHLTGAGAPRSYAAAETLARIAEAAGDPGATALLTDIAGRMTRRGEATRKAWAGARAKAGESALDLWLSQDLAARLGGG